MRSPFGPYGLSSSTLPHSSHFPSGSGSMIVILPILLLIIKHLPASAHSILEPILDASSLERPSASRPHPIQAHQMTLSAYLLYSSESSAFPCSQSLAQP